VAAEVIAVILGDKWRFAVVPLTWISLVLPLGMISGILLSVLKSLGRADVSLKNMLVAVVLMPGAFLMGCHWGILGISLAWVIAFPIYFLATLWRSLPHIGLRMLDLFNVMGKSVFASIIMYLVVAIIKYYGKGHVAPILELALLVSAGGSAYAGVQLWINREDVQEFTRFGRNMFTESH
jgi:O-antigen/teichoic acid export membrane protein